MPALCVENTSVSIGEERRTEGRKENWHWPRVYHVQGIFCIFSFNPCKNYTRKLIPILTGQEMETHIEMTCPGSLMQQAAKLRFASKPAHSKTNIQPIAQAARVVGWSTQQLNFHILLISPFQPFSTSTFSTPFPLLQASLWRSAVAWSSNYNQQCSHRNYWRAGRVGNTCNPFADCTWMHMAHGSMRVQGGPRREAHIYISN